MKIKAIVSSLIVVLHLLIMVWYYTQDSQWLRINKDIASIMFFGISFILIGLNGFISASNTKLPIQVEIAKFHSIFIMLLGTIFGLHYSGIMITSNKEKLIMICAGVLVILVIILISAWRHGFFKKETYE